MTVNSVQNSHIRIHQATPFTDGDTLIAKNHLKYLYLPRFFAALLVIHFHEIKGLRSHREWGELQKHVQSI